MSTTIVPADLKALNTVTTTLFTGRSPRKITCIEQKTYTPASNRVSFNLPSAGIFDFTTGYLAFTAMTYPVGSGGPPMTTWSAFANLISSCIYAVRFKQGTRTVAEITDYGYKAVQNWYLTTDYINNTNQLYEIGCAALGNGTAAENKRTEWGCNRTTYPNGREYHIPLDFGPFKRPFNFSAMHDPCYFEIDFYPPNQCLECDATSATNGTLSYAINNIYFMVDELPAIESGWFTTKGLNQLVAGQWPMLETDIITTPINGLSNAVIQIPHKSESVQRIRIIQLPAAELYTPNIVDRFIEARLSAMTLFRLRVNGAYFPMDPVVTTGAVGNNEAWWHFKRAWWSAGIEPYKFDQRININRDQFYSVSAHKFFLTISLEQNHAPGDLNPVKIMRDDGLFLELAWSTPYTGNVMVLADHWVVYRYEANGTMGAYR